MSYVGLKGLKASMICPISTARAGYIADAIIVPVIPKNKSSFSGNVIN